MHLSVQSWVPGHSCSEPVKVTIKRNHLLQPWGEHVLFPSISSMTQQGIHLFRQTGQQYENWQYLPWISLESNSTTKFYMLFSNLKPQIYTWRENVPVLVSSGCHNKVPETWWLKQLKKKKKVCTVLEAGSPGSGCLHSQFWWRPSFWFWDATFSLHPQTARKEALQTLWCIFILGT